MRQLNPTITPITVRVVDFGCEYIPETIGGREVTYLHSSDGTVLRISGKQWGYDLDVTAECWQGRIPDAADRSVTWMCKCRHQGATHKQVTRWWADEIAGLHREGADA